MAVGMWGELDVAIVELLPDQGSKRGKYLPDAKSTRTIADELDDPEIKAPNVAKRLTQLAREDLVVAIINNDGHGKHLWQRTPKGKAFLERKERSREHAGN